MLLLPVTATASGTGDGDGAGAGGRAVTVGTTQGSRSSASVRGLASRPSTSAAYHQWALHNRWLRILRRPVTAVRKMRTVLTTKQLQGWCHRRRRRRHRPQSQSSAGLSTPVPSQTPAPSLATRCYWCTTGQGRRCGPRPPHCTPCPSSSW